MNSRVVMFLLMCGVVGDGPGERAGAYSGNQVTL